MPDKIPAWGCRVEFIFRSEAAAREYADKIAAWMRTHSTVLPGPANQSGRIPEAMPLLEPPVASLIEAHISVGEGSWELPEPSQAN